MGLKFRQKVRNLWSRIKRWIYSALVSLGLVMPLALAAPTDFTYTAATERVDGTPLALSDIAFTKLYCNDVMVSQEDGADGGFTVDLGLGSHTCYATHVDVEGQESDPSNLVTKLVLPARPNGPSNLQ